jgi:uncharacterized protein (TIGR02217 family)
LHSIKQAQIDELIAFFRARRGRAYSFRFKDWTDYTATGQLLGTGDDAKTQFQLVKEYPSGSVIEVRTITKPVAGTVEVYLDGLKQLAGWSVDTITGLVTFGIPPALGDGVVARASPTTAGRWSIAARPRSPGRSPSSSASCRRCRARRRSGRSGSTLRKATDP